MRPTRWLFLNRSRSTRSTSRSEGGVNDSNGTHVTRRVRVSKNDPCFLIKRLDRPMQLYQYVISKMHRLCRYCCCLRAIPRIQNGSEALTVRKPSRVRDHCDVHLCTAYFDVYHQVTSDVQLRSYCTFKMSYEICQLNCTL